MENSIYVILSLLLIPLSLKSLGGPGTATARVCTKISNPGRSIQHKAVSFKRLVEESGVFVDKSLLIRHFLETHNKIVRYIYPRGWGKSINLDMLRVYFQAELDSDGQTINEENTYNYRLFVQGIAKSGNITKLEIMENPAYVFEHIGKYSVVHISFPICNFADWSKVIECLDSTVKETYRQHHYMLNILKKAIGSAKDHKTSEETSNELATFTNYYSGKPNEEALEKSLQFLSKVLKKHIGLPVFILIDGYDALINSPLSNLSFLTETKTVNYEMDCAIKFLNAFLQNTLLRNEHYTKSFVTGCVKISRHTLYLGEDIREYGLLNNQFYRHFGFSHEEVTQLFSDVGMTPKLGFEAKRWYRGYTVKNNKNVTLYNPRSITNFVSKQIVDNYWIKSLGWPSQFLKDLTKNIRIQPTLISLINRDSVELNRESIDVSRDGISQLRPILRGKQIMQPITSELRQLFYSYLFSVGYLTLDRQCCEKKTTNILKIPNREVVSVISDYLRKYYEDKYNTPVIVSDRVKKEFDSLVEGKNSTLQTTLEEYVRTFPVFFGKKSGFNEEVVYSALNLMILMATQNKKHNSEVYLKTTNENKTHELRPNIMLGSRETNLGVSIHVVYEGSADEALVRAEKSAQYFKDFRGIDKFKFLGVSVFGNKTVDVKETFGKFLRPWKEDDRYM